MGIFQIPCALAPNYATMVVFRFFAGFCCAVTFNSVGIISDMWDPDYQSWPVNTFALSAEAGANLGTIMGGYIFVETGNWRWIFGVGGIGTAILLVLFIAFVPETRAGVILTRRAAKMRKETGEQRYHSHHEIVLQNRTVYAIMQETLLRPVYMLFREPIVLWFALFDGFNYAIIYLALESIPLIYAQWGFSEGALNLPFLGIFIGELIAFCLYYFQLKLELRDCRKYNGILPPESRLYWMLLGGVVFPASLFWFAWTTQGPPLPWIVSILALGLFGISSHIIFISVSDYTIAAYSIYSASAVGAQSLLREMLSGSVTLFATPLYNNLGYQWASTLLGFIALAMAFVPPILYFFGPRIRAASAFAQQIKEAEAEAKRDALNAKEDYDRSRSQSRAGTDREILQEQVRQSEKSKTQTPADVKVPAANGETQNNTPADVEAQKDTPHSAS
jgi:DHA1 family multidrug resistance protein-like MFS transporter